MVHSRTRSEEAGSWQGLAGTGGNHLSWFWPYRSSGTSSRSRSLYLLGAYFRSLITRLLLSQLLLRFQSGSRTPPARHPPMPVVHFLLAPQTCPDMSLSSNEYESSSNCRGLDPHADVPSLPTRVGAPSQRNIGMRSPWAYVTASLASVASRIN